MSSWSVDSAVGPSTVCSPLVTVVVRPSWRGCCHCCEALNTTLYILSPLIIQQKTLAPSIPKALPGRRFKHGKLEHLQTLSSHASGIIWYNKVQHPVWVVTNMIYSVNPLTDAKPSLNQIRPRPTYNTDT